MMQTIKETTAEPKAKFVEIGTLELSVKIKSLSREKALYAEREIRRALQSCVSIKQLDEFVVTRIVEYAEIPREELK
jgi:hypothetical protein